MRGVTLYVGTTGTGKTHAALADLRETRLRQVVADLGGSSLLAELPMRGAGQPGLLGGRYQPETSGDLDALLDRCYRAGNVALLVDDAAALRSKELPRLCRLWRPRNLRILITTQHISGDVEQAIMACDPLIFAFRTTSPRSLEWLEKWHGVQPEEVAALGMGEALELSF